MTTVDQLKGWVPIRIYWREGQPTVDWLFLGDQPLSEPFFEQSVARALRNPAQLLFRPQTPISILEEFAEMAPDLAPTGFVFHLSRCGSTLISQVLASVPCNLVVSEAPPIEHLLGARLRDPRITHAQQVVWLRGLVRALGRRRFAAEKYFYIKFDSWHLLHLSLIREAFPDTPWIFLYREPLEVLVSQRRLRGAHMLPGVVDLRLFGFVREDLATLSFDEYAARVLACICQNALRTHETSPAGRLVNFSELPGAIWGDLAEFFGADYSEEERSRMSDASRFNAKNPKVRHADDTAAKQREAGDDLRELEKAWLTDLYRELETRRLSRLWTGRMRGGGSASSRR
ncbi:MAG: sulfotransferase family protein [Verrucomicrobia bacterium]|nr:sulfotransferase family protein [Verrucomicrobiota bacterium]